MKTVLTELKEKLQGKVDNPMSIQIECDIFQRVVDVIDEVYFEKERQQIIEAHEKGQNVYSDIIRLDKSTKYFNDTFLAE